MEGPTAGAASTGFDMFVLIVISAIALFLFILWRTRYQYPPEGAPQVLCYHKLSGSFLLEGTWTTRARFTTQVDRLRSRGYTFIGQHDFLEALDESAQEKTKRLLLTFDDGYEQLYDLYFEVLAPRQIPLLVFLVTAYAGRTNSWELSLGRKPFRHLSWRQVREMAARGVAFGSHGLDHSDLTRLRGDALDDQLVTSRRTIRDEAGIDARCFSYPFGRYNDRVVLAARNAGYDAAFSLYPRHSNRQIDRFALRRNAVYIIDTPMTLGCKLEQNPLFWVEEMKCRAINAVAVLTPLLKRVQPGRDR